MHIHEILAEAHHAYDDPRFDTAFQPMKTGDTVRVFHGFNNFEHALEVAKYGLSGKERVSRVYSYESDNNPNGLFVTLSFKTAAGFHGAYDEHCIIEFNAALDELEAPVWPGGSYTVQGGLSQYFGHGAPGRAARRQQQRDSERETGADMARRKDPFLTHVAQSDRQHLAYLLTTGSEYQALFVGDLHPDAIVAFYIRAKNAGITAPWTRLTPAEFASRYSARPITSDKDRRVFAPNEEFDGERFMARLSARMNRGNSKLEISNLLSDSWARISQSSRPAHQFLQYFGTYLWPRQYLDAMRWMKRTYSTAV